MSRAGLLRCFTLCLLSLVSVLTTSSATPSVSTYRHARHDHSPSAPAPLGPFPWFNYSLPIDVRAHSLVQAMSVGEKLSSMSNKQPAITRLGLPYYDWESEGSHGVARAGRATVFPSPIMMASTFSVDISYRAGRVVSMEGRGKFNDYVNKHGGNNTRWYSLDFLAPNSQTAQYNTGREAQIQTLLVVACLTPIAARSPPSSHLLPPALFCSLCSLIFCPQSTSSFIPSGVEDKRRTVRTRT